MDYIIYGFDWCDDTKALRKSMINENVKYKVLGKEILDTMKQALYPEPVRQPLLFKVLQDGEHEFLETFE